MGGPVKEQRLLHAKLCEVERGLYHIVYRMDGMGFGHHPLPRYEVGATDLDARMRVEERVRECGYGPVVWDTDVTDDALPQVLAGRQDADLTH